MGRSQDPTPDERVAHAAGLLQKADRRRGQAALLRKQLPGTIRTRDEIRAFAIWWQTEEGRWSAHKEAIETIMGPLDDDHEATVAIVNGDLDELGKRVKLFVDFCNQEITPLIARLEKGLATIEATDASDEKSPALRAQFAKLRQRVRVALPDAWQLAAPAALLYRRLPAPLREEAERRWGPLAGTDPGDFSPLWRTHFPQARLNALDDRARPLFSHEGA